MVPPQQNKDKKRDREAARLAETEEQRLKREKKNEKERDRYATEKAAEEAAKKERRAKKTANQRARRAAKKEKEAEAARIKKEKAAERQRKHRKLKKEREEAAALKRQQQQQQKAEAANALFSLGQQNQRQQQQQQQEQMAASPRNVAPNVATGNDNSNKQMLERLESLEHQVSNVDSTINKTLTNMDSTIKNMNSTMKSMESKFDAIIDAKKQGCCNNHVGVDDMDDEAQQDASNSFPTKVDGQKKAIPKTRSSSQKIRVVYKGEDVPTNWRKKEEPLIVSSLTAAIEGLVGTAEKYCSMLYDNNEEVSLQKMQDIEQQMSIMFKKEVDKEEGIPYASKIKDGYYRLKPNVDWSKKHLQCLVPEGEEMDMKQTGWYGVDMFVNIKDAESGAHTDPQGGLLIILKGWKDLYMAPPTNRTKIGKTRYYESDPFKDPDARKPNNNAHPDWRKMVELDRLDAAWIPGDHLHTLRSKAGTVGINICLKS